MDFKSFKTIYQKEEVKKYTNAVGSNTLVSVCVQTYQHAKFIEECLEGILNQKTNFDFEIILGDDDSKDGTTEICLKYAKQYANRIRFIAHKRMNNIAINGRPSGRFNMLYNLYSAKGKYIALCEGDDYWTDPLKLQKQVDFLENNQDVNICFTRAQLLKNEVFSMHDIPKPFYNNSFKYIELLKHYNFIATCSVAFRKPLHFEFPNWFHKLPFGDLGIYKLVSEDKDIQCIDEVMSVYRIHDNGVYSGISALKKQQNYLNFYKAIFPALNSEEKQIASLKIKEVTYRISKLKFPNRPWFQKFYNRYLHLKF
ncbi:MULTISPECIES: glycosyltransferase family 2 protein [Winogradskyella]|uniref:Glycosyltransferase involved in cell wall bisynthesis n=1 Tax=Winogradskyella thalassocola TaxID=262004 RepID=A0A1G8FXK1_9FLAO|nr:MULTISPECIES: glycosyltransferase [Winogradskyella]SDH86861.1 Glycosyltransferase involved in cell wall bisynthesis [Winogradskyella thalassocola]